MVREETEIKKSSTLPHHNDQISNEYQQQTGTLYALIQQMKATRLTI